MAAIVTDQFRVQNASTFVDSVENNSYYIFLGLANPSNPVPGFGRTDTWDSTVSGGSVPPPPIDILRGALVIIIALKAYVLHN